MIVIKAIHHLFTTHIKFLVSSFVLLRNMFKINVRFWQNYLKLDEALFAGIAIATAKKSNEV